MRNSKEFLDVDYIGGLGQLSKEDEQKLSEYFKAKRQNQLKNSSGRKDRKAKGEKV